MHRVNPAQCNYMERAQKAIDTWCREGVGNLIKINEEIASYEIG